MAWSCGAANDVWASSPLAIHKWPRVMENIHQLWEKITTNLQPTDVETAAIILRQIWTRRIEHVFQGKIQSPERVNTAVLLDKNEFLSAQKLCLAVFPPVQLSRQLSRWKVSKRGWVKINWDAAVFEKKHMMGVGVVIRDDHGEVTACLSAPQTCFSHPIVAETRAPWKAFQFCKDLGFEYGFFEGDSQQLVTAINSEADCDAWYGHLIEEAKIFLKNQPYWSVSFVHREGNQAAPFRYI